MIIMIDGPRRHLRVLNRDATGMARGASGRIVEARVRFGVLEDYLRVGNFSMQLVRIFFFVHSCCTFSLFEVDEPLEKSGLPL